MQASFGKKLLSLTLFLFVGLLVFTIPSHAQAAEPWFCERKDSDIEGYSTQALCVEKCLNGDRTPGTCTEADPAPDPTGGVGNADPTGQPGDDPSVSPKTGASIADPKNVPAPTPPGGFVPLTNLPGLPDDTGKRTLADYINVLFRLSIGIGALVAVIKITYAGIQYMGTDAFSSKEQAKKDITGALLGLLLMLSTVVILKLIYPDILNINVLQKLEPVKALEPPPPPQGTSAISATDQVVFTAERQKSGKTTNILDSAEYRNVPGTVNATVVNREQAFNTNCRNVKKGTPERIPINEGGTFVGVRVYCMGSAPQ